MNKYSNYADCSGILDTWTATSDDMFVPDIPWDGTFLGTLTANHIINKGEILGKKIWNIKFLGSKIMVYNAINSISCINDEILQLFKLQKIGSHCARYKSRLVILYKILETDNLLSNYSNSNLLIFPDLKHKIQKIISMKLTLGWTKFNEENILLRTVNGEIFPIPIHENTICNLNNKILTRKMEQKYDINILTGRTMFPKLLMSAIGKEFCLGSFLMKNEIEAVITKIDSELIYIINPINTIISKP